MDILEELIVKNNKDKNLLKTTDYHYIEALEPLDVKRKSLDFFFLYCVHQ